MGVNQLYFGMACRHHFFQFYCKYHCIPPIFSLLLLLKTLCLTQPIATNRIKICAAIFYIIQVSDSYETHLPYFVSLPSL